MFREGLLLVVSGPSGAGKGTLLSQVRNHNTNIRFSVSATTRSPRIGEVEGVNYFYKTTDEFEQMIAGNELVEWAEYCDHYYGTPVKYIVDSMKQGFDVILELDVKGALNIRQQFPDSVLIFIVPPSFEELQRRLEGRGTESAEVIGKRLNKARNEVQSIHLYDYVVINDEIEQAAKSISNVIKAEKLRYHRNQEILNTLFA